MPTPSEEKAAFLKAKILAKRSTSNSRATNGTSKPGTPKPATQPQTTRPVSGPSVQVKGDEAQQSASKFVDQLATAPHQRVDSNPTAKPSVSIFLPLYTPSPKSLSYLAYGSMLHVKIDSLSLPFEAFNAICTYY
jgi:hypothetical protein